MKSGGASVCDPNMHSLVWNTVMACLAWTPKGSKMRQVVKCRFTKMGETHDAGGEGREREREGLLV